MRALLVCLVALNVWAGEPKKAAAPTEPELQNGRYRIVDASKETGTVRIYLLDTATGQTWITCNSSRYSELWCEVPLGGPIMMKQASQ